MSVSTPHLTQKKLHAAPLCLSPSPLPVYFNTTVHMMQLFLVQFYPLLLNNCVLHSFWRSQSKNSPYFTQLHIPSPCSLGLSLVSVLRHVNPLRSRNTCSINNICLPPPDVARRPVQILKPQFCAISDRSCVPTALFFTRPL
jgi:hypothetical protein